MALPVIGIPCCRWWLNDTQFFHLVTEKYVEAAKGAGGLPLLIPALGDTIAAGEILAHVDGLLLTGSPSNIEPHHYGGQPVEGDFNDARRDATTLPLIRSAVDAGVPVLGICRGFQEMNVAFGGSLHQAVHAQPGLLDHREPSGNLDERYGPAHEVALVEGGMLHALFGRTSARVNSLHKQGIATLGSGLVAEAHAPDGLIEAFRVADTRGFALAVQWHPEWKYWENPLSQALFAAFGTACTQHARASRHIEPRRQA
ncbi:gamma-glutamyl-gamma-aminobutyrate hydrolase family protein [Jeongeupia naejangsanensis]|uniref:Gamma-glutamyl-gamma-aminobutyrate hydrolase family protein n=1 Tax=Jeongeupia naejangsanensis TaxID=613195 RepID=A0ABS2BQ81_9NEIS|nr:gamma-glutamyl-gamma-aminobutyrate hydrolase family protein [Jeongeupia naejangsanensis]MBM3117782.1 gamma-glutamyl-gamma-aminobutyrate hydrolase family protein [Jeongeupia naejangsanensis]